MAAPKKPTVNTKLTYEEAIKAIKSIKGSKSIVGEEIPELCTVKKQMTGIPTLDYETGGGLSRGRITIIGGKPSSGKTTTTLMAIAKLIEDIKASGEVGFGLYVDSEGGYDSPYARALGVDEKYLIIKRGKVIETVFQEADDLISMGIIKFMVIDSLDSMISKKGDDNAYSATMGGTAGALSQHLPTLYNKIMEYDVTTIIIKQARVKMGGYNPTGAEIIQISGGYTLKHLADTILITQRLSNKNLTYTPIQLKAEKTRSTRMGICLDMPLHLNEGVGIDPVRDAFFLLKDHGFITVGGAGWTSWKNFREQGEDNFIRMIRSDKELTKQFIDEVYNNVIFSSLVCSSNSQGESVITEYETDEKTE